MTTATSSVDLTSCEREPIHIPGTIQPHGVLLALSGPDLVVTQASDNASRHLGTEVAALLGRRLADLVDAALAEAIGRALTTERWAQANPWPIRVGERAFDGIVHRHDGVAILELEPALHPAEPGVDHPLRLALAGIQSARTLAELCDGVAREVKQLTGFERVMVYRFDEDGHGSVEAEVVDEGFDRYLGLHYPASDIPRQARELYLKNWLRIIPDARYAPARLVPDTGAPLDLSFAVLRSVSPIHLEYLANMGVRASMSLSLVVRDHLWGLISCAHHSGPRFVPYQFRSVCEALGRLASLQIAALETREAADLRAARRGTLESLAAGMREGNDVLGGLVSRPAELLGLVGATGAAVVEEDEVRTCGQTPPAQVVTAITQQLPTPRDATLVSTSSLRDLVPEAGACADVASGLLAVAIAGSPPRWVMWFRPEAVHTVSWGGDPRKPAEADASMRIHPRRSFELWKEEVRYRSRRWTLADREAAEELRRFAVEIDLERQLARARQAVRARDDLVAVVSHDLKNPVNVVQMQVVLLLRLAAEGESEQWRRLRASAERIQHAVDRMNTLTQNLLDLAKIEAGRFAITCRPEDVRDIITEAMLIMTPLAQAKRIAIDEQVTDVHALADRERVFQVLSNLVGNALKFTPDGGRVTVRAERSGHEVLFTVADTGPGIPSAQLSHLFDRFWQAPKTRERAAGSGLGLYIAKGIVEAHGGRIWVESPPGTGARFMFTLHPA